MTHKFILLAQYSLLHHSTNLRRVSRPTAPPSASDSLAADATEGTGEGIRDGNLDEIGDAVVLVFADAPLGVIQPFTFEYPFSFPFALSSLPAFDRLSLFPLPNLFQTWPSLLRCLFSWKMRHMSFWWFFLCSESTALSSREVQEGENSGEWKKAEKRERVGARAAVATLK